jgi:hypothetical protein
MSSKKKKKLSAKEIRFLLSHVSLPGDIVTYSRGHPHISDSTPYLHIDIITVRFEGGDRFTYLSMEHRPVRRLTDHTDISILAIRTPT